ncbi:hypothetical protein BU16DRAFT_560270 [Lophium mytilinum]|uniref:Rhodopsin domain-containing protein n=1 Tax=Lophium mytilinum TaxID=390894 RepID=A0A6A6QX10_9PEZI|nr:hypothetical protein BU16DRAFT_560270 [Lophium mytilinum]
MHSNPTTRQLIVESVVFWCIAFFLFIGRIWSRAIAKKSILNLQPDDYVMVVTFGCYTTLLILIQLSGHFGTNEYDPATRAEILANAHDVASRIRGSKIVVGSNQCYLLTLWGVKACLCTLYYQMTRRTFQNFFVKLVIGYVVLGFIATEIPLFILCRPFSQYWSIFPYSTQCTTYHTYCIIQTVFNISSDALMLAIPIPMILRASVKPAKKAALVGVFSMGVFVILAAFLNKYYNFTLPGTTVYMVWHIREASVSVMVANLMCWWPLLRKVFGWKAFVSVKKSMQIRSGTGERRRWYGTGKSEHEAGVDLEDMERTGSRDAIVHPFKSLHSVEGIALDDASEASTKGRREKLDQKIVVTTEIKTNLF